MSVTNAALRSRIERLAKRWRPLLGLESWDIEIRYDETTHLGSCVAKPRYGEATIWFNLPRIRRELPNTVLALEELVVHELVHCLIWRSSESAVSWVTRSILRARDAT